MKKEAQLTEEEEDSFVIAGEKGWKYMRGINDNGELSIDELENLIRKPMRMLGEDPDRHSIPGMARVVKETPMETPLIEGNNIRRVYFEGSRFESSTQVV